MARFNKFGERENTSATPNQDETSRQGGESIFRPITGLRQTRSSRNGLWARYDDFISDIGYWFKSYGETMATYISYALLAIGIICLVGYIGHAFSKGDLFSAIIITCVSVPMGGIAFCITFYLLLAVFFVFRLIFSNGVAFLCIVILLFMGAMHLYIGVPKTQIKQIAAQQNHESQGSAPKESFYVDEEDKKHQAFLVGLEAAQSGNDEAQCRIGNCYYDGWGIAKNAELAAYWWTRAAQNGNAKAMRCLGFCYQNGYGVKMDLNKAANYYRQASERGDAEARKLLDSLPRCPPNDNDAQMEPLFNMLDQLDDGLDESIQRAVNALELKWNPNDDLHPKRIPRRKESRRRSR